MAPDQATTIAILTAALLAEAPRLPTVVPLGTTVTADLPTAAERLEAPIEAARGRAEAALPAPAQLVSDLTGADLSTMTGAGGALRAFPRAMTKQVYGCTAHDLVLAVATNEGAARALESEIGTLRAYHGLGMRSAMHTPISRQVSPLFSVTVDGRECRAALQPFCVGAMAQLKAKEPPHASEVIDRTLADWKAAVRGGALPLVEHARRLAVLREDMRRIVDHVVSEREPLMLDLQFFLDPDTGRATLLDPGDPATGHAPSGAQKTESRRWLQAVEGDVDAVRRRNRTLKDPEIAGLLS